MPKKIIGNTTATPNPRPDWAQTDEAKADYIKNKPTGLESFLKVSTDDNGKIIEVADGTYVLKDIASSSVGVYVQAVVDGTLNEIDELIGGEDADEGEGG
jgi:hypothetical protein